MEKIYVLYERIDSECAININTYTTFEKAKKELEKLKNYYKANFKEKEKEMSEGDNYFWIYDICRVKIIETTINKPINI